MKDSFQQILMANWEPGPYHQVASLSTTMAELCATHGFVPDRIEVDGLGVVQFVGLALADSTRFLLEWGEEAPSTDVIVSTDARDPAYDAAMKKLLCALGLEPSVVVFQHEDGSYDELLQRQREAGFDV